MSLYNVLHDHFSSGTTTKVKNKLENYLLISVIFRIFLYQNSKEKFLPRFFLIILIKNLRWRTNQMNF